MPLQLPTEVLVLDQEFSDNRPQTAIFLRQWMPIRPRIVGLHKVRAHGLEGGLLDLYVRYHRGRPLPCVYP